MINPLNTFFKSKKRAALPEGQRVYAIGDIHGRIDLFEALIAAIEADDMDQDAAQSTVVLLGDLIDRGPDSRGVIDRARRWQSSRDVRIIMGNHEEMFMDAIEDKNSLRHFIRVGGKETILSYGIERDTYNRASIEELLALVQTCTPQDHRDFIATFDEMIEIGDFLFVHAGIDPKRTIEDQRPKDTRWIREKFLRHSKPFEKMIIHGHTIFEEIDEQPNRIGIDTGAYRYGRLTALVLEGGGHRYIQAVEHNSGQISTQHRDPLT